VTAESEILAQLQQAVLDYDGNSAAALAQAALESGLDPLRVLDVLTLTIRSVGDRFGRGECWLPDLVGAADALSAATAIVEAAIQRPAGVPVGRRGGQESQAATVVIGTVSGDIHNIGKNMVATLLKASGFNVHDVGVNIKADRFVEAVKTTNADILALSALLTTTAPEQKKVIQALKDEGIRERVKVMVGGAAITREFATGIGADGYEATAIGAVELAKRWSGRGV
jgi:methanogenic corrinoid protein MtbC1